MEYLQYDSLYYQLYSIQPYWKEYADYEISDIGGNYLIKCKDRNIYYDHFQLLCEIDIIENGMEYQIGIDKNQTWLSGLLITNKYIFDNTYERFNSRLLYFDSSDEEI